jgi:hypothetical protein
VTQMRRLIATIFFVAVPIGLAAAAGAVPHPA